MNCGCAIEIDTDECGPAFVTEKDCRARVEHKCVECKRVIRKGEVYRRETGKWDAGIYTYCTCLDCLSLRDAFFCGFYFGKIWSDFWDDVQGSGGNFNLSALAELTPAAREKACELIEAVWADCEDEEEEV